MKVKTSKPYFINFNFFSRASPMKWGNSYKKAMFWILATEALRIHGSEMGTALIQYGTSYLCVFFLYNKDIVNNIGS